MFLTSCGVFWATTQVIKLPPAWRTFEFCQYAEIGRNLALDHTYDTRLVEPMALAVIDRDRVGSVTERWPVVNRYPLPCLVIAGLMSVAGPDDTAAAWSNGLAISLLAALSYSVARAWFGSGWAAVVAILFLASPSFYGEFILLGTPDVWFAVIFLAQLVVYSRLEPGRAGPPRLEWAFALGVLSGLAYLARFNATMFLAVQVAALLRWRRWREVLVVVITTGLFTIPLMLYNWHHFHRPWVSIYSSWNLLDDIGAYKVEPWLYYRVPALWSELATHAEGVAKKFATNLFEVVPVRIWNLWRLDLLLPLALLGLILNRKNQRVYRFAVWSIGFFALQLIVFSAMRLELEDRNSPHHGRYFFWFATPALLLGVGLLRHLAEQKQLGRWIAGLVVLLQLTSFGWSWAQIVPRHAEGTNIGQDPIRSMIVDATQKGKVVASNQPQITAWFCNLRSISLPADPVELARLNQNSPTPADYIFIDTNFVCIDLDQRWRMLANQDVRIGSEWLPELLQDYQFVIPPRMTQGIGYVFLRRRVVPPNDWERDFNRQNPR
ncbi:glycosyltransferase family 39 protein [Singulisphaera sp. Ch08]|uniref:Glycosyltransferase family 39 protein n=1 Tax=Singulisphaera sp. Ch08 TaxID=3120278 RepID=A0AAU7CQQ0_9BACT